MREVIPVDEKIKLSGSGGVDRILRVLAAFTKFSAPIGARELAAHVCLPESTVYRMVAVLRDLGFVTDMGRDLGFIPGPVCAQLGETANFWPLLEREALPQMEQLSEETHETVGLMVRMRNQMMCLRIIESPHSLRCTVTEGVVLPMGRGASAKLLLAFSEKPIQRSVAQEVPEASRSAFLDELQRISKSGHAISDGELDHGVWGVSAPILGEGKRLIAGLTLMAPSSRAQNQREALIQKTISVAARVSQRVSDALTIPANLSTASKKFLAGEGLC